MCVFEIWIRDTSVGAVTTLQLENLGFFYIYLIYIFIYIIITLKNPSTSIGIELKTEHNRNYFRDLRCFGIVGSVDC